MDGGCGDGNGHQTFEVLFVCVDVCVLVFCVTASTYVS